MEAEAIVDAIEKLLNAKKVAWVHVNTKEMKSLASDEKSPTN